MNTTESDANNELRPRNGRSGISGRHQRRAVRCKTIETVISAPHLTTSLRFEMSQTNNTIPAKNENREAIQVFEELLVTEGRYVQRLEAIRVIRQRIHDRTENFKSDTRELLHQALDPPGLEAIISLHKNEILPQLENRYNEKGELCFGSIFSDKYIAPYFKVYAEFLSRKEIFDIRIDKLRQNQHVRPHLIRAETEDIPQLLNGLKLSLNALLLEPVQRLPRYELLLRDYIKRLPDAHDDKVPACAAHGIIQEANQRNNLKKAEAENHGKLASLAKSISGLNDVVDGSRNLVFHGFCQKIGQRHYKPKKAEVLILSDMIIIVMDKHIGRGKEAKHKLQLSGLITDEMEMPLIGKNLSDIRSVNGLRLSSVTETIDLINADDESSNSTPVKEINSVLKEEMRKWKTNLETFRNLNDSKNSYQKDNSSFDDEESVNSNISSNSHCVNQRIKFRLGERAPRLIHETDVSMCMICWKIFGFGSSRHHCRACGNILCSNCSTRQLPLNYSGKDDHSMIVCVPCYKQLLTAPDMRPEAKIPEHFDDLWRKCNKQGYLRVRRKDDSEFQKCWCAIIPSWGTATWIFTARKAPCDTGPIYERPLLSCQFNQVVQHNAREWNLVLGIDRFYILLEDKDTKNDWVTAIRHGIQVSEEIQTPEPRILSRTSTRVPERDTTLIARPTFSSDGTKSLDRSSDGRPCTQRDLRVRSMHESQIGPISYPKEISPDLSHQSRLHSLKAGTRVHRSHSLRTADRSELISQPLSCADPRSQSFIPIHTLQSQSQTQRISNRSIRHQMSANSLDDVYLKADSVANPEECDEKRTGTFSRGIKERFSARFKLGSKINSFVNNKHGSYKQIKPRSKSP